MQWLKSLMVKHSSPSSHSLPVFPEGCSSCVVYGEGGPVRVILMRDSPTYRVNSNTSIHLDEHLSRFPEGDILIMTGNPMQLLSYEESVNRHNYLMKISHERKYESVVVIPGTRIETERDCLSDMDETDAKQCPKGLIQNLSPNIHYLEEGLVSIHGLRIYGAPWLASETVDFNTSPPLSNSQFFMNIRSVAKKWENIPACDILVTFIPPFGIGDTRHIDTSKDEHSGCTVLLQRVIELQPSLHVCAQMYCSSGAYSHPHCIKTCFIIPPYSDDRDESSSTRSYVFDISPPRLLRYEPEFNALDLDIYVATLVAVDSTCMEFTDEETRTLHACLRVGCKEKDNRIESVGKELYLMLWRRGLLTALPRARKLSLSANEDSPLDFRAMQLVIPRLYIGPVYAAESLESLQAHGITHVCCCMNTSPRFVEKLIYHVVEVDDVEEEDLYVHFEKCIGFIQSCIDQRGSVLVHCHMGMSRSATICIVYLMYAHRISFKQAYALVKRARPFICPNDGFMKQMKLYESTIPNESNINV